MTKGLRVVIVDDDQIIADTLAQILRISDIEAVAVHSGEAAIRLASTFRPDAVILDVIMPDLNGIETALVILQVLPACRIILFSGHQETSSLLAQASKLGHIFTVFAKPVHPLDFIEALGPLPGAAQVAAN